MKRYLLPALVAGFGAAVLSVIPYARNFTCCLFVPFAAYYALALDMRATQNYKLINAGDAVFIGLLTGVFAGFLSASFEVVITLITRSSDVIDSFGNMQMTVNSLPITDDLKKQVINLISGIVNDLKNNGFSLLYTISLLLNNLIVDGIFGLAGGLIGMQIINRNIKKIDRGQN